MQDLQSFHLQRRSLLHQILVQVVRQGRVVHQCQVVQQVQIGRQEEYRQDCQVQFQIVR